MAHLHWMFIPRASFPALVMLWFVFDFLCLRTFEDFLFKVRKPSKVNLGEKIYGKIFKKPLACAKIKYYIRLYEFKCCEDARISRIKFWHLKRESFYVSKKLIWAGAFNSKAWWILVVVWAVFFTWIWCGIDVRVIRIHDFHQSVETLSCWLIQKWRGASSFQHLPHRSECDLRF